MSQDIIKFNVGGIHYDVSRSLLNAHSNSMLAKSASQQWHQDPLEEIYIERSGERFQLILDYLRDGTVILPVTIPKDALLADFRYFGFHDVNSKDIIETRATTYLFGQCTLLVQDMIQAWDSKVVEHQRIIRELTDSKTILSAFSTFKSIYLYNLKREGGSFRNCNEHLRLVGLCVEKEDLGPFDTSTNRHLYNVTLKLLVGSSASDKDESSSTVLEAIRRSRNDRNVGSFNSDKDSIWTSRSDRNAFEVSHDIIKS